MMADPVCDMSKFSNHSLFCFGGEYHLRVKGLFLFFSFSIHVNDMDLYDQPSSSGICISVRRFVLRSKHVNSFLTMQM